MTLKRTRITISRGARALPVAGKAPAKAAQGEEEQHRELWEIQSGQNVGWEGGENESQGGRTGGARTVDDQLAVRPYPIKVSRCWRDLKRGVSLLSMLTSCRAENGLRGRAPR